MGLSDRIHGLFEVIDGARWGDLPAFFTADCRYDRPGYAPIVGLAELETFYASRRVIASGKHAIARILSSEDSVVALGSFEGVLKSGEVARVEFSDAYVFAGDKIRLRKTYFYQAAV